MPHDTVAGRAVRMAVDGETVLDRVAGDAGQAVWCEALRPVAPGEQAWCWQDGTGEVLAELVWSPGLGLTVPRAHFRRGQAVHASRELNLFHRVGTLLAGHDLTGAAEVRAWRWRLDRPESWDAALALLAAAMAAHGPQSAGRGWVLELPGWRDAHDHSPFWAGFGAHFYAEQSPWAAHDALALARPQGWMDRLRVGEAWSSALRALWPQQLVYVDFLPPEARAALGRPHEALAGLPERLRALGWRCSPYVRLDDGGPVWLWGEEPTAG